MSQAKRHPRQLWLFGEPAPKKRPTAEVETPEPPEKRIRASAETVEHAESKARLRARLEALMGERFADLVLTQNRRRMVSLQPAPRGGRVLRIHGCFVDAPDEVLGAVAIFFITRRKAERAAALAIIRGYFDVHAEIEAKSPRRIVLQPRGDVYDLELIRDDVNRRFFAGELEVAITWGARPRKRRRRTRTVSVRLGTYTREHNLVRIHRTLDRSTVPLYVVESVVHHEMLHAVVPPIETPGRRRQIHPPEFRRRERLYPRFEDAERWISENLGDLARPH